MFNHNHSCVTAQTVDIYVHTKSTRAHTRTGVDVDPRVALGAFCLFTIITALHHAITRFKLVFTYNDQACFAYHSTMWTVWGTVF